MHFIFGHDILVTLISEQKFVEDYLRIKNLFHTFIGELFSLTFYYSFYVLPVEA